MGKTIFVGARKGGVGKTMTAASLGFGLARAGKASSAFMDSYHRLKRAVKLTPIEQKREQLNNQQAPAGRRTTARQLRAR